MRKYYQAALLAVAVVSLVSLLFYRHEYNKLRYVLEVFNYFGKPDLKEHTDNNCTKDSTKSEQVRLDFDEPFSSWQRLSDDFFVYSSYGERKREVVTIGFGKLYRNLNLNCDIYLFEENKLVPGKFSYSVMKNTTDIVGNDKYGGYVLKCEYMEEGNPVGVTYYQKSDDNNNNNNNNLILPVKQLIQPLNVDSYAFCVAPSENKITLSEMNNFLNTHKSIGVDDFILYDYGIPSVFYKAVESTERHTKIPWNFPFLKVDSRVIKEIIEFDCLYRTYNNAMYTAVLSWEEYIVLNYHSSLHQLMIDFKKNKMYGNRFMLKSSVSCIEKKDDKYKATSTVARKQEGNGKHRPVYILKSDEVLHNENIKTMEVLPELVVVKRYQVCDNAQESVKRKFSNYRKSFRFAGDT